MVSWWLALLGTQWGPESWLSVRTGCSPSALSPCSFVDPIERWCWKQLMLSISGLSGSWALYQQCKGGQVTATLNEENRNEVAARGQQSKTPALPLMEMLSAWDFGLTWDLTSLFSLLNTEELSLTLAHTTHYPAQPLVWKWNLKFGNSPLIKHPILKIQRSPILPHPPCLSPCPIWRIHNWLIKS